MKNILNLESKLKLLTKIYEFYNKCFLFIEHKNYDYIYITKNISNTINFYFDYNNFKFECKGAN
jgi:hypothetical protein